MEELEMARVVEQTDHAARRLIAARPELFARKGRGRGREWKNWKWRELLNKRIMRRGG